MNNIIYTVLIFKGNEMESIKCFSLPSKALNYLNSETLMSFNNFDLQSINDMSSKLQNTLFKGSTIIINELDEE